LNITFKVYGDSVFLLFPDLLNTTYLTDPCKKPKTKTIKKQLTQWRRKSSL